MAGPAQRFEADRLNFPGMLLREILIWRNWLRQFESRFERYDYNIRVGQGVDPGPSYPPNVREQAIVNSKKRIDVVAWEGLHGATFPKGVESGADVYAVVPFARATIIEVEENPGLSAAGQLLGYRALWDAENPRALAPKMWMVCARINADASYVLGSAQIEVQVVPTDFAALKAQK